MFTGERTETQLELFASDAPVVPSGDRVVQVVLDRVRWERPRDFGEVFLARHLWRLLGLDELLEERMGRGGEEIPWPVMAFILTAARLIAPSSELAIEERFYGRTARLFYVGVERGPDGDDLPRDFNDFEVAARESAAAYLDGKLWGFIRHARVSEEQVSEFWEQMADLVREFDRLPRSGDTVYGFAVGVYPTDHPTLPAT